MLLQHVSTTKQIVVSFSSIKFKLEIFKIICNHKPLAWKYLQMIMQTYINIMMKKTCMRLFFIFRLALRKNTSHLCFKVTFPAYLEGE